MIQWVGVLLLDHVDPHTGTYINLANHEIQLKTRIFTKFPSTLRDQSIFDRIVATLA